MVKSKSSRKQLFSRVQVHIIILYVWDNDHGCKLIHGQILHESIREKKIH
jgi:hypothetical protein